MCFGLGVFAFILFRTFWISWICSFFYQIFTHDFFKYSFCPFSLWDSLLRICWYTWWGPTYFVGCVHFSLCFVHWILLVDLSSSSLIFFLRAHCCYWNPVVNFSFKLLYFLVPEFLFGSFKNIIFLFIEILYLLTHCPPGSISSVCFFELFEHI